MPSDLGQKIGYLREKSKLTQKQLGLRIGKKKNTIGSYEGGHSNPSIWILKALAIQFKVTTDYLLGNDHKTLDLEGLSDESISILEDMRNHLLIGRNMRRKEWSLEENM